MSLHEYVEVGHCEGVWGCGGVGVWGCGGVGVWGCGGVGVWGCGGVGVSCIVNTYPFE